MRTRILTILIVLAAATVAHAQVPQVRQYAAKFVCGTSNGKAFNVAPGTYLTTINVHNPARTGGIGFRKKFALAEMDEKAGTISKWFDAKLAADQAMQIDCRNIYAHLGIAVGTFIDGFAVIELSPKQELDVVGVYTAGPSGGGAVSTMHLERVAGRLTQ
jgi:hypothetical protein